MTRARDRTKWYIQFLHPKSDAWSMKVRSDGGFSWAKRSTAERSARLFLKTHPDYLVRLTNDRSEFWYVA